MRAVAAVRAQPLGVLGMCQWMDDHGIVLRHSVEDRIHHLLDGAIRRVDSERRTRISLTPFFHQLGDALFNRYAALRQHRARFDAACDSPRNYLRACTEAYNHAAIMECRIILRVNDRATAERDDRRPPIATLRAASGIRSNFRNYASFHSAEMRLAAIFEDLMNRLSGSRADLGIAINQAPSEAPRQMARHSAFAGRHKAGQDNLFHRSSMRRAPLSRSIAHARTTNLRRGLITFGVIFF